MKAFFNTCAVAASVMGAIFLYEECDRVAAYYLTAAILCALFAIQAAITESK